MPKRSIKRIKGRSSRRIQKDRKSKGLKPVKKSQKAKKSPKMAKAQRRRSEKKTKKTMKTQRPKKIQIQKDVAKKKSRALKKVKKRLLKTKASAQYEKALKEFGRAVHEFNRRGFMEAKEKFLEIIRKYPREQELAENARTYIKICEKHLERRTPRPKELDDFYHYGIMQLNNENYKEAIKYFDKAISFDPKNEKVLYAKAAAYALSGHKEEAVANLKGAIKIEPQNRIRARMDPDFDSLRTDSEFSELIETPEEI